MVVVLVILLLKFLEKYKINKDFFNDKKLNTILKLRFYINIKKIN